MANKGESQNKNYVILIKNFEFTKTVGVACRFRASVFKVPFKVYELFRKLFHYLHGMFQKRVMLVYRVIL